MFQNFKDRKRLGAFFKIVFALPAIPVWNYLAKLEIRDIEKNDFIYRIRNNKVVFYLPDLNWGGEITYRTGFFWQEIILRSGI